MKPEREAAMVRETTVDYERVVILENERLRAVVCPGHGASILELVHRPTETQLLWQAPGGLRQPRDNLPAEYDNSTSFFDYYPGGCQIILPNGGPSVRHNGVELGFHGEACKIAWKWSLTRRPGTAGVACETFLRRVPLEVALTYSLDDAASCIQIETTVRNVSNAPVDCMWGLHPAYSEPFLGSRTRLHIRAGDVQAHPEQFGRQQHVRPGFRAQWPTGPDGGRLDYLFPGNGATADLVYLKCEEGWYVLHNEATGVAATVTWDCELFPFVWFWQECQDAAGYPWFGRYHIVGVEPFTSYPSSGLVEALKHGNALRVAPSNSVSTVMRIGATAFCTRKSLVVSGVKDEGSVIFQEGEQND